MDGKQLLKNKLLKIKESMDNLSNIVEYGYTEKTSNEANLKLDNIMKMLLEWPWVIMSEKVNIG